MSTLAEIETAADALTRAEKKHLLHFLAGRLWEESASEDETVANEPGEDEDWGIRGTHSVLEIPPISVGRILRPLSAEDDLLDEMLEGRL